MRTKLGYAFFFGALFATSQLALADAPVGLTNDKMSVEVQHNGKPVSIERVQDGSNTVAPDFALTSRACPPFCIQPMNLGSGVETLGELEILDYLEKKSKGDDSILVIDSRTPDWVSKGTIPGSVNISWVELNKAKGATTESIITLMTEKFGVKLGEGVEAIDVDEAIVEGRGSEVFDFTNAKTLVMFCNGMWCGQSPVSIATLMKFGYPGEKLKWFRGGMQTWAILGLTTVKP